MALGQACAVGPAVDGRDMSQGGSEAASTRRAGRRSSASSRHAAPNDMKGDVMSKRNIVRYEIDPKRPKPLTAAQKAELAALAALPDERTDTSEVPRLSESFWTNAVRNPFFAPGHAS